MPDENRRISLDSTEIRIIEGSLRVLVPYKKHIHYTKFSSFIYYTDEAFKKIRRIPVNLPDIKDVSSKTGEKADELDYFVTVTKVENGWIYFKCYIPPCFRYYRITTNGKQIEKIDMGESY